MKKSGKKAYAMLYLPDHQAADPKGYVAEHRLIWAEANGRWPESNEDIHHINGDSLDNRAENLVALTKVDHLSEHAEERIEAHRKFLDENPHHYHVAGEKGRRSRWGH